MKATSVGDVSTWEVTEDTLLDDKLGFTALEGITGIDSLSSGNRGDAGNDLTKIAVRDLVAFAHSSTKYTAIEELEADEVDSTFVYYVYSYNATTGVLKVMSALDDDEADETYIVTADTVIYDCTGTPVMADDGDLYEDAKIQVFAAGSIVYSIKLVN